LGFSVEEASIETDWGGGYCVHGSHRRSTLTTLPDGFVFILAGSVAEALVDETEGGEGWRWWQVDPVNVLELEKGTPRSPRGFGTGLGYRDFLELAASLRYATMYDTEPWLKRQLEMARRRAAELLCEHADALGALAQRLRNEGPVDLRGRRLEVEREVLI
jgi:hypothetical protein